MIAPAEAPPADRSLGAGRSYKWWVIFMLWFVCFLNYADRQSISAVFPKLKEEFGFDKVELGLIGSAFSWVYAFGAPFAGLVADRLRRKEIILNSCILWSGLTVATAGCFSKLHFIMVRALVGLGETCYYPAAMSLASDYHGTGTRSRALSLHQSGVYVGTIAGGWAGAWFAEHYGWRVGFYVFGAAGVVLALVLYGFLHEPPRVNQRLDGSLPPAMGVAETVRAVFRTPTAIILMLAFVGANLVALIFLTWAPTFLVEKFGFKLAAAGLSGTMFIHLASAVSAPLAGILADVWAKRHPGGRILVQGMGLLLGAIFVVVVGATTRVGVLLAAMTCFGFCKGFYDANIFAALFDVVEPRIRATAAGLMNMVGWSGGALGPVYVGWISKHGARGSEMANMSVAISWCGAVYVVCAAGLVWAAFRFAPSDVRSAIKA